MQKPSSSVEKLQKHPKEIEFAKTKDSVGENYNFLKKRLKKIPFSPYDDNHDEVSSDCEDITQQEQFTSEQPLRPRLLVPLLATQFS